MAEDQKFKDKSLQFLNEIHKSLEAGESPKKYIIGNKLGLDPIETQGIVDYLKKNEFVRESDTPIQEKDATIFEITDKGRLKVNSAT